MDQGREKKIDCPCHKKSNNCFESEYDGVKNYLCAGCGYTSTSEFKLESEMRQKVEDQNPQIVNDLKMHDSDRDIYWYPSVINIPGVGAIFPEGDISDWKYSAVPVVEIGEAEKENFAIPGQDGMYFETRLAIEQAKHFEQDDFASAMEWLGAVQK